MQKLQLNPVAFSFIPFMEPNTFFNTSAVFIVILLPSVTSSSALAISSLVRTADCALLEARFPIWSATTANPLPASPALAASMEAFLSFLL